MFRIFALMNNYITSFPISSFRVDCHKRLKPYAFMTMAQEVANLNASALGCGYSHLLEHNITWVLSRMKTEYVKSPIFLQDTVMETWHKGMNGPFSIRDFEVRDASTSEILVRCTTSWVLVDLDSRHLVRMDRYIGPLLEQTAIKKDAIVKPAGKIKPRSEITFAMSHKVLFSDIDYNMHVNNAKYMEWAIDVIDARERADTSNREIASYEITFNNEARMEDIIDIYIGNISDRERYVEGRRGNEIIFQSIINFL
ncbi:MAG: hypothetical protein KBS57_06330 [Alistipes sp.]|nr:hypothetical protein [Candidatus Minthomonas equi]